MGHAGHIFLGLSNMCVTQKNPHDSILLNNVKCICALMSEANKRGWSVTIRQILVNCRTYVTLLASLCLNLSVLYVSELQSI